MGVMYRAADDVAELLVPFVAARGGRRSVPEIERAYREASLGALDPDRFWQSVGLDPDVEDDYLQAHELMPGLLQFLEQSNVPIWCLSNDVARWSEKLRRRFTLEHHFAGFLISSAIRARKPDVAAYQALLDQVRAPAKDVLFIDDREANIAAARGLGIDARLFRGFDQVIRLDVRNH